MILKLSVLKSGAVLADGQPIAMDHLDELLQATKANEGTIWYYREAAAGAPPAEAMEALKLVIKHKLAISMSSKPDFSDWVDNKGVSHPKKALPGAANGGGQIRIPEVDLSADVDAVFDEARSMAMGDQRGLVIVRPDRKLLFSPAPPADPELDRMSAGMERMIPGATPRNIVVIASTGFRADPAEPLNVAEVNKAIPFFGILIGLSYIGHAVWVFEGHASAMSAACRDADILIVDSALRPLLHEGWLEEAAEVMRNANILVHDRNSFQLRIVRKVGQDSDRLEFLN